MKKFGLLFAFSLLLLTACGTAQAPEDGDVVLMDEAEEEVVEIAESGVYGSWIRQATYVDGALEHTTPATLNIRSDGSYDSSTDICSTSGTQVIKDSVITVTMTQSDCPGGIQLPLVVTYNFGISEDGESMSMTTANVKEDYNRAE
jgi:hypothetical protein